MSNHDFKLISCAEAKALFESDDTPQRSYMDRMLERCDIAIRLAIREGVTSVDVPVDLHGFFCANENEELADNVANVLTELGYNAWVGRIDRDPSAEYKDPTNVTYYVAISGW
jgi:hypothetical protein